MSVPAPTRLVLSLLAGSALLASVAAGQLGSPVHQVFQQYVSEAEPGDRMASSLTAGDFNGDGRDDLAIGIPGEDTAAGNGDAILDAGRVWILYGTANGILSVGSLSLKQAIPATGSGANSLAGTGDRFGAALATGDFDDDGFEDLAVGIPGDSNSDLSPSVTSGAGAVEVYHGSAGGLESVDTIRLTQADPDILGFHAPDEELGAALAVGDFDLDGYDDIAVGVPGETIGGDADAGGVHVFYGSAAGLTKVDDQFLDQDSPDVILNADPDDRFGHSLAAGDLGGDAADDLVVGVPGDEILGSPGAGTVHRFLGAIGTGVTLDDGYAFPTESGTDNHFGWSLAVADVTGEGKEELIVGEEGASFGGNPDRSGLIRIIWDDPSTAQIVDCILSVEQAAGDAPEAFDRYGWVVVSGDFDRDGRGDVVTGVPGENLEGTTTKLDVGALEVRMARDPGAIGCASLDFGSTFHLDAPPIHHRSAVANDGYAEALSVGDFNGNGFPDLAIGVPGAEGGSTDDGVVVMLWNVNLFADGFESGDTSRWSSSVP